MNSTTTQSTGKTLNQRFNDLKAEVVGLYPPPAKGFTRDRGNGNLLIGEGRVPANSVAGCLDWLLQNLRIGAGEWFAEYLRLLEDRETHPPSVVYDQRPLARASRQRIAWNAAYLKALNLWIATKEFGAGGEIPVDKKDGGER